MSTIPTGRFVWYQLNAKDVDAARDFYTGVIGWKTELWEEGDGPPYTMLANEAGQVGGIMAMPEDAHDAPQHWLTYISTPDVDKTVMKARDHGAQVFVPPSDLAVGRFAVLADPQGATFAVFTPNDPPEDTAFDPQPGDVSWHELVTTDHEKALRFYSDLFRWDKTDSMDMGEMGTYQIFGRNGTSLGGMFNKSPEMPAPPHWGLYFRVSDVTERVERIKSLGGQLLNGPMDVPGGVVAQCMDPQGGAFSIHTETTS